MTTATEPSVSEDAVVGDAVVEDASGVLADPPAGRFHNRENPSPAEMAEILREVQDSLAALEERLSGLEGAQGDSSVVTRRLALSVAEMGETLARRVRSLESGGTAPPLAAQPAPAPAVPPRPFAATLAARPAPAGVLGTRRVDTWVLILGFVLVVGLVAIGLWVFSRQVAAGPKNAKHAIALVARGAAHVPPPAPTPPTSVQAPASAPSTPTPRGHILYPVRHRTVRAAPTPPAAAPTAPAPALTGFRSFGPATAANSAVKPPSS